MRSVYNPDNQCWDESSYEIEETEMSEREPLLEGAKVVATRITMKEAKRLGLAPKRHKYRAVATTVDGVRFASKREAKRYGELKLLEAAGKIRALALQPRFRLEVKETLVCHYVGDFLYVKAENGREVLEDCKGFRTREYKLKKKLFEALYGMKIVEV